MLPHWANGYLAFDERNTSAEQESWEWDAERGNKEVGEIDGEAFEESGEEEEGDDSDSYYDGEGGEAMDGEEDEEMDAEEQGEEAAGGEDDEGAGEQQEQQQEMEMQGWLA